jgi:hypothetical protein
MSNSDASPYYPDSPDREYGSYTKTGYLRNIDILEKFYEHMHDLKRFRDIDFIQYIFDKMDKYAITIGKCKDDLYYVDGIWNAFEPIDKIKEEYEIMDAHTATHPCDNSERYLCFPRNSTQRFTRYYYDFGKENNVPVMLIPIIKEYDIYIQQRMHYVELAELEVKKNKMKEICAKMLALSTDDETKRELTEIADSLN